MYALTGAERRPLLQSCKIHGRFMQRSSKPRKNRKRPLGFLKGQIWMAADFNAPMKLVEDCEVTELAADKGVAKKKRKRKLSRPAKRDSHDTPAYPALTLARDARFGSCRAIAIRPCGAGT